jgi:hypothetical protein
MGAVDNQEQANLATSIVNQSLQNVANYCTISCNDNISNLDIVVVGGNDTINIGQVCSIVGSECMIKNLISTQVDNLVKNIVQQQQSNMGIFSLFGPSSSETTNISTAIKNQVSQLINNTCSQSSDNNISNSTVFAQDANLDLTISQSGSIQKAQCALDTVAKLLINNDVQNQVKQTQSSCGNILAILIVVAVIVLLFILFPLLRGISSGAGAIVSGAGTAAGKGLRGAGNVVGGVTGVKNTQ